MDNQRPILRLKIPGRTSKVAPGGGDLIRFDLAKRLAVLRAAKLHMSQRSFAERFGLQYETIKDTELGKGYPSRAIRVLVAAIEMDPDLIERAAAKVMADQDALIGVTK
jgi:transcriptional regulator with XRE-family HTH domain